MLFPSLPGASLLPMRPRRILQNANMLFESGQFAEAAPLLENLASLARQQGIPRAPFLFARAARANALSRKPQHAVQLFRTAFDLLAATDAVALLFPAARRIVDDLSQLGHVKEADEIRDFVAGMPGWEAVMPAAAQSLPSLPTHCPQCGAGIRSDEVQWIDANTAECTYCGSPVR